MDGQGIKWHINIAENFNRLSSALERYRRQTDDRRTDGWQHIANVNVSLRSLKSQSWDVTWGQISDAWRRDDPAQLAAAIPQLTTIQ